MKRILVVEDDVELCLALAKLLNNAGFEVGVADSASRAMSMLEEADPIPHLMLVDVENGDGRRLCEMLKYRTQYSSMQIVEMTAGEAHPAEVETCATRGITRILHEIVTHLQ